MLLLGVWLPSLQLPLSEVGKQQLHRMSRPGAVMAALELCLCHGDYRNSRQPLLVDFWHDECCGLS